MKETLRQAGAPERLGDPLADEQRLRGVLQDDGVAGEQAGYDGVDRGEIRVVPRRDHHHDPERLAGDVAAEAGFLRRVIRLERFIGHRRHGADALFDAALLAAIADGSAHLPGELDGDVIVHGEECVEESEHVARALRNRNRPPLGQRGTGRGQRRVDLGVAGDRPLGIDRAVDGGDDPYSL